MNNIFNTGSTSDGEALPKEKQISLFEGLPIPPPRMPNINTQTWHAANAFMQGHRLNHLDFMGMGCGYRLAAVVRRLKNLGWPVESVAILGVIKIYYINPENIRLIRGSWL